MDWNENKSVRLSQACVVLFAVCLLLLDCLCYFAVRWFTGLRGMPWQTGKLMMQVIFDARNVALLRAVSWCCVGAGLICLVSGVYYLPFAVIAIAAGFMALIVRIVKNVFRQAILMKDDLDLMI